MRKGRCCPVMEKRVKCTDIQDNFPASTSKRKEEGEMDSMFSTGLLHDSLWLFVFVFVLVLLNSVHRTVKYLVCIELQNIDMLGEITCESKQSILLISPDLRSVYELCIPYRDSVANQTVPSVVVGSQ